MVVSTGSTVCMNHCYCTQTREKTNSILELVIVNGIDISACNTSFVCLFFSQCTRNPKDDICERVKQMGEKFCTMYAQVNENFPL